MQNRREFLQLLIAGAAASLVLPKVNFGQTKSADVWTTEYPKILARIVPPKFKNKDYKITKYGAAADGKTLATDAIKKAIDECSKNGGGRVVVPSGTFLTGAVHLKSNVNLYISKGATLKFSMNPKDYLPIVHTRWEGMELMHLSPFIYAYEQQNIAVTGEGTLDGQGKSFFWKWHGNPKYGGNPDVLSQKPARARLYEMMDKGVPVEQRIFGGETDYRTNLMKFVTEVRAKNAFPILLTPVMRRKFDDSGNFVDTHGEYPNAVRKVAAELKVPLIDMHLRSEKVLKDLGAEKSRSLFLQLKAGENPNYPNGIEDNTHFNPTGADAMAKLAIVEIKNSKIGLRKYLKK